MGDIVSDQSLSDLITGKKRTSPFDIQNLGRTALQGLGMGWGDEGEAWLRSKLGEDYDEALKRIRSEYGQYAKDNPMTALGAEFAGGVIPGLATAGISTGATTAGTLARMGALGAATGAVSGAGSAEEGNRGSGAISGGVIGGGLGVGIPAAMRGAGAAGKWLAERKAAYNMPDDVAGSTIEQRLAAMPEAIRNSVGSKMTAAMAESDIKPADLTRIAGEDAARKIPSVVANADNALSDLAESVAQRTGKGARKVEDTLTAQRLGSKERAYEQASKALKPGNYYADEEAMVKGLRDKAKTMYDNAYSVGEVNDPKILSILELPEMKNAYATARKIADADASAAVVRGEDPAKYLLRDVYKASVDPVTKAMTFTTQTLPDVRTLDYMKKALDAQIKSGYKSDDASVLANMNAMKDIRNGLRDRLKDVVPEYKAALKEYGGDSEVINALRAGMNEFKSMDHEQVAKMVAGMGDAEKQAFRTGVARDIYSKIMDPSGNFNAAQRVFGSPETQQKLRPLFNSDGEFKLFKAAMERESQLFNQSNKILGGAQTAKRLQMQGVLEDQPGMGSAIGNAVTGGWKQGLVGLVKGAIDSGKMTEKTAARLADMLMAKDPHEVAAVVKLLEAHAAEQAPKVIKAGQRQTGAVTGATIASAPAPRVYRQDSIDEGTNTDGPDIESDIEEDLKRQSGR